MKQFAIYTAVIGNYDTIHQPLVVDDRFDYILFSDCLNVEQIGVWQVRKVDYYNDIQTKIARYVKTHSHTLLPEYKATLWIDASVLIKSKSVYKRIIDLFNQGVLISTHLHPIRDCIYDEMFSVLENGYETEDIILKWGKELRKNKYPPHNGLCETGVLFRGDADKTRFFNECWWSYIEKYSRRDQLSFNFVLSQLHIPFVPFLPENTPIRNSSYIDIHEHSNEMAKYEDIGADSWLIKHYRKHPTEKERIKNVYYQIYNTHYPKFWAALWGQMFRFLDFVNRHYETGKTISILQD